MDGADEVAIVPRFPHDMVVNTGEMSSQKSAQLIYEKFMERPKN